MFSSPWHYFTDPVLQAPTIGSMLMCFSSALIGVIAVLRKRSLLGEALSHACYPGVVLGVLFMATFFPLASDAAVFAILGGATMTSLLGLLLIDQMERRFRVKNDAALCFVLAVFFGFGVLVASRVQFTYPLWYKMASMFLYGQAATMTDVHIVLYTCFALALSVVLLALYRRIQMVIFDKGFAKTVGLSTRVIETFLFFLLVFALVIGIRSVGVVLMVGMLIAPAVAARQFSHRLGIIFVLAAAIGALSGFLGNYFSVELPEWGRRQGYMEGFSLPTGPMILLSASAICLLSLFFAPRAGLISRLWRIFCFREQRMEDNLLKYLWRQGEMGEALLSTLQQWQSLPFLRLQVLIWRLKRQGWVEEKEGSIVRLTKEGRIRATRIVRLHRLWEAYLVFLGQGVEKVHRSAEEMEHIITPELEGELAELLGHPKRDPHAQPIPSKDQGS